MKNNRWADKRLKVPAVLVAAGLMLMLLLYGCGRKNPYQDIVDYMKQVKQDQVGLFNQLHKFDVKAPTSVVYNGNLRRSPFEEAAQVSVGPEKAGASNPLQAYSLNMLRLLGTVTEKGVTVAYIATPDNMVYRAQVGDMIGDHHGKIISIQPGAVSVMELDTSNPNEQMQRVESLKLRNDI